MSLIARVGVGDLVQHIDGRQGRVEEVGLVVGALPAARVSGFRGQPEIVPLGYIWSTRLEENWC